MRAQSLWVANTKVKSVGRDRYTISIDTRFRPMTLSSLPTKLGRAGVGSMCDILDR